MNTEHLYELCKQCYISICRPKKKAIKHIVLSNYKEPCVNCGKTERLVIDIDDEEEE
jgi:hypothetical protein